MHDHQPLIGKRALAPPPEQMAGRVGLLLPICDPPYDFRDKGDNTLTTRFHLKTKEIDFNTLTKHARAHFNELVLLSHITH